MRNNAGSKCWSVGELAKMSGVTIRTLHHYDEIGLLRPALIGENGYRFYGREELLRLQQILFHRELGMALADIAAVLDAPGYDRIVALRRLRERVLHETDRQCRLLATIDRTIADLEGVQPMTDNQLYEGLSPEKQAEYEAYLIGKYGEGSRARIEEGRRRMEQMSAEGRQAHLDELADIEGDLAKACASGVAPDDGLLDPVLARHRAWVAKGWGTDPAPEAYAGLGELYRTHPDFVARYDAMQPGFADWLAEAMGAFAHRSSGSAG